MIRIFLKNSEQLELFEKTSISITLNNPIFDKESIDRVYTFSFRIGLTPKNRILLRHGNRMDNSDYFEDDDSLLEIDGFPFLRGNLTIKDFRNDTALASFKSKTLGILQELSKIKINTILHQYNVNSVLQYKLNFFPESDVFSVTVDNKVYQSEIASPQSAAVEIRDLINIDHPGVASSAQVGTLPDLYTELSIIGTAADTIIINERSLKGMSIGSKLEVLTFDQAAFITEINNVIQSGSETHAFPVVNFFNFYDGKNDRFRTVGGSRVNNYVNDSINPNQAMSNGEGWNTAIVPFVRLNHVLKMAFDSVGISHYFGTLVDLPDFNQLLIFNNYALDKINPNNDTNEHRGLYDLNNHVPDLSALDVLKKILQGFCQWVRFSGSGLEFKFNKEQLLSPPIDWTGKSSQEYKKVPLLIDGFQLGIVPDPLDKNPTDTDYQLNPYYYGNGLVPFSTDFGVLYDYTYDDTSYQYVTCRHQSNGSSDELEMGQTGYPFKLFFERGLRTDSLSRSYPMSTNGNLDVHDNKIGNFTLRPNGEEGLHDYFFKGYIEYINNPSIMKKIHLNIGDIFTLLKWDNALRKITTNEGEFTGIVKSVTFKAHMNKSIDLADVEFIRYASN